MKTPLGLISFFTALSLAALMAVSCGKDKIIVEKPVIYDTNGLPVVTIKTENGAGVPSDKTQSIKCSIKLVDPEGRPVETLSPGKIPGSRLLTHHGFGYAIEVRTLTESP